MTIRTHLLAAAAAIGALAVPAAAQSTYPYQSYQVEQAPQPYPGQPGYGYQQPYAGQPAYGQPSYGYNQGYAQGPVEQIIGQLLGNRYNVSDRSAVSRCASAAMVQAQNQYRGNGYSQGYGNGYNNNGYPAPAGMRVTSITSVERRNNGLRVSGLMSSGYRGQHAGQYGYQNRGYGNPGYDSANLSFRCNVDYRGTVTALRVRPADAYRG